MLELGNDFNRNCLIIYSKEELELILRRKHVKLYPKTKGKNSAYLHSGKTIRLYKKMHDYMLGSRPISRYRRTL